MPDKNKIKSLLGLHLVVCLFGCAEAPNASSTTFDGCSESTVEIVSTGLHADELGPSDVGLYTTTPAAFGDHSPQWLGWGVYNEPVAPELYLHNLEHGGLAYFYDCPTGCPLLIERLKEHTRSFPPDDGGDFRFILAPYPGMGHRIAVVAWGAIYRGECVDTAMTLFKEAHYRKAPDDVAQQGTLP